MSTTFRSRQSAQSVHTQIQVYNTLSRTKEPLETVTPGRVGMYLCGPTVYKPSHIGHMVGPVIFDTIKRYLRYSGYDVVWVVNITDVDDKLIAEASRRSIPMAEVAREMTADYLRNLAALGVDGVDHFPRATANMGEIMAFIETLLAKGFAYTSAGDVYFDVSQDPEYGKLSRRGLDSIQGEGGETGAQKRNVADFALWKAAKPGEPAWDSPWGRGRPGWHIECSAMSRALLGETFDIHGGGLDLVFPHHENEIAQSECCHGKPMARFWMHNGLMQASAEVGKIGGRRTRSADDLSAPQATAKISKSTGARPFSELLEHHPPETVRFFLLTTHYRRPIDFSESRLSEVHAGLESFYRFFKRYERITGTSFYDLAPTESRAAADRLLEEQPSPPPGIAEHRRRFLAAMDDDFNTGAAVGELFDLLRTLNRHCDDARFESDTTAEASALAALASGARILRELGGILGLFRHDVIQPSASVTGAADSRLSDGLIRLLIELRGAARTRKDFATADRIRDGLKQLGIALEDRPGGTEWTFE
jgi:cysteinyl-tRNA synthetase